MACRIAVLWDEEVDLEGDTPFEKEHMNKTYQKITEIAESHGAELYVGNYEWMADNILKQSFQHENGWRKRDAVHVDVVFDKYHFNGDTEELKKRLQEKLPVLNRFELEKLCKDKLMTYQNFPELVPETVEAEYDEVEELLENYGKVIVKPRYDFGGKGVEVVESLDQFADYIKEHGKENIIAQRFVDSSGGIPELGVTGVHDLRILVVDDEAVGAYVREPAEGLISNVSRGGTLAFYSLEDVPDRAFGVVDEVKKKFNGFRPCFYSIDMSFDQNGDPWILEFNSKPGLSFYEDPDIEEHKTPVIEKVVKTLVDLC